MAAMRMKRMRMMRKMTMLRFMVAVGVGARESRGWWFEKEELVEVCSDGVCECVLLVKS